MRDHHGTPKSLYGDRGPAAFAGATRGNVCRALAGDASIRAFDLSNEIDDAQRLPSRDAGWLWAALAGWIAAARGARRPGTVRRAPAVPDGQYTHCVSTTSPA